MSGETSNGENHLLARADYRLTPLWSPRRSEALAATHSLFQADLTTEEESGYAHPPSSFHVEESSRLFLQLLDSAAPNMPDTPSERLCVVLNCVNGLIRRWRLSPTSVFVEDYLATALRPLRSLGSVAASGGSAGADASLAASEELTELLADFCRGVWDIHLTKMQRNKLHQAIAVTFSSMAPEQLYTHWKRLADSGPERHDALIELLDNLTHAHSVAAMLYCLDRSSSHEIRTEIVTRLETIAHPLALPLLFRLRHETAFHDWTLSRLIARTIRVIEQQNPGIDLTTLLRPSEGDKSGAEMLRSASLNASSNPDSEAKLLLRTPKTEENGRRS